MTSFQGIRKRWFRLHAARRFARFGDGSAVLPPITVLSAHRIEIGDGVQVFEHVCFSVIEAFRGQAYAPRLRIGDRTIVGPRVWFSCVGEIDIDAEVLIGAGALIADSFHEYTDPSVSILRQPMAPSQGIRVGRGSFIGPGAVLMAGTRMGEGCYVAPNAVVSGVIPAHTVVAGNPSEVVRRLDPEANAWVDHGGERWESTLRALGVRTKQSSD